MNADLGSILDGRYRLDSVLGRGAMGVVYRGTQLALDRAVAIKRLARAPSASDPAALRFRREATASGRLSHPGIVRVFDAGVAEGAPYLVMELVEGDPLDEILARRGPLQVEEALSIAWQLADALASAHEHGVLHRDVKPANVLLEHTGRVRVVDFGLALSLDAPEERLTQVGAIVGTPEYLAPELARGAAPDPRADVYALGATLYELLTDQPPFEGPTPMATVLAHLEGKLIAPSRRLPGIPPAVDALVQSLLARRPSERPAHAGEARNAIEACRLGLPATRSAPARKDRPSYSPSRTSEVRDLSPRELDAVLLAALAGDERSPA